MHSLCIHKLSLILHPAIRRPLRNSRSFGWTTSIRRASLLTPSRSCVLWPRHLAMSPARFPSSTWPRNGRPKWWTFCTKWKGVGRRKRHKGHAQWPGASCRMTFLKWPLASASWALKRQHGWHLGRAFGWNRVKLVKLSIFFRKLSWNWCSIVTAICCHISEREASVKPVGTGRLGWASDVSSGEQHASRNAQSQDEICGDANHQRRHHGTGALKRVRKWRIYPQIGKLNIF